MSKLLLFSLFLLSACASTPDKILSPSDEMLSEKKKTACAEHPELDNEWGECNVQKKIAEKIPAIKACYEKKMEHGEILHGDLMLKIKVWKSGKVKNVFIVEGSLKNKLISDCLISNIRKITFAKPPKGQDPVIFFPFTLDRVRVKSK